ncbi:carboxy terminal-processing peptidase [Marinomonas mediterranea]|jgi:C-terminal peptidase (prc)|uniref:Carboxyl-terminal protease n=1 Tax=Marinomonas mediterranea (strain ATCC 700492 / JCM 21426 / NBRC 103028 / MMB-1) TaxID=717774 RepID=F2K1K2_MARM1|nr:carboxy terminal-processing peptidase [Marinomonas mediterranea]ADZ92232.1 carboxyl-terminal protease [Marinomonas mediterranea MMB-1]WCN10189.1 tail-specific protease [Marinomonas mediterranea]WCN18290.1 tail-specific protease [Marinomonas mediterranea MMB-1]
MNYKRLLVSLLVAGASLTSSLANAYTDLQQPHDYDQVAKELTEMLEAVHYNRPTIDDRISASAFDLYLDSLDPTKSFFLKSDIDKLSKHRLELDDALRDGKTQIAYDIYNLYMHRVEDRLNQLVKELPDMVSNFDYTKEESLNVDFDTIQWSETPQALDEYWRKRIKNRALTLKLNDEPVDKIASVIEKRYRNQLKQIEQTEPADVFQTFANSITAALDPHTTYFAPRASETFNINMSLSLEGIGAVLQYDDDYTKVVRLIPGGPAEKQNELAPNDRILAVGQDNKEMVDVVGMRLDDVVDMIRGERGTKVYLEIQPAKGDGQTTKTINITREKVKLEDQAAKKKIINVERGGETYKVGVIELPTFYSDFAAIQAGDRDYKSSTRDTKKLIEELRQEGVIAIVLDLRNNGGGSLQEANSLAGLFIPRGPIVQIKDTSGRVSVMGDRDPSVTYSGPLGVLVNRMSASASEIVAAALQDYGRALILGGQTFGKGTVQVLQEMDKGQLKVTQAKFYRVSGESTQHKGVHPDIAFPSLLDEKSVGESALKHPLPWDKIHETRYAVYWKMDDYLPVLEPRHEQRMKEEPNFVAMVDQINDVREQASTFKSISLNEEARLQLREEGKEKSIARENKRRKALGLDPITKEDEIEPSEDDPYAQEAAEVMLDFIAANQLK